MATISFIDASNGTITWSPVTNVSNENWDAFQNQFHRNLDNS